MFQPSDSKLWDTTAGSSQISYEENNYFCLSLLSLTRRDNEGEVYVPHVADRVCLFDGGTL
jgi:hypothetical protein